MLTPMQPTNGWMPAVQVDLCLKDDNVMILRDKYVLHIPCFKLINGGYEPVDAVAVIDAFSKRLAEQGIDALYYEKAMGRYKGREYEQFLVTVFCNMSMTT